VYQYVILNKNRANNMKKERITITIDKKLLDWIDEKIKEKVFANRSHAMEFLIKQQELKEKKHKGHHYIG